MTHIIQPTVSSAQRNDMYDAEYLTIVSESLISLYFLLVRKFFNRPGMLYILKFLNEQVWGD